MRNVRAASQIQVAVFGSSGDVATDSELALARELGGLLAVRGIAVLVGSSSGVMGEVARSVRRAGGRSVGVLPRDLPDYDPTAFDSVIETGLGWVQFSDVLLRSSIGGIVIGGGAGTLAEVAMSYLAQHPLVFLGDGTAAGYAVPGPLDRRDLIRYQRFDAASEALEALLGATESVPLNDVVKLAEDLHFASYPFGTGSRYREAADIYGAAVALQDPRRPAKEAAALRALAEDALGDHLYYDVADFLSASSRYVRALQLVDGDPAQAEFSAYLHAIVLESIAGGLSDAGEYAVAASVAGQAEARYRTAAEAVVGDEGLRLMHSAEGLLGDSCLYAAFAAVQQNDLSSAVERAQEARRAYDRALEYRPGWSGSATEDTFEHAQSHLEKLDAAIATLRSGQ